MRHPDVRNSFLLFGSDGALLGRHDKDLPTMWENALYVGGDDDGRIAVGELTIGVALCWELLRTATVKRLVVAVGYGRWLPFNAFAPRKQYEREGP